MRRDSSGGISRVPVVGASGAGEPVIQREEIDGIPVRSIAPGLRLSLLSALFTSLLVTGVAEAQPTSSNAGGAATGSADPAAAIVRAGTLTGEVDIDGFIDEPAWDAAPLISGFVQSEPEEGAPASYDTHVRVLIDDDAIYVAARMWDDPETITSILNRRDEGGPFFDWFGVSLDPGLTRRNGYSFRVNTAGVQQDVYVTDDTQMDRFWDAVWESAVQHDSLGWTAEIRLPLSQLRFHSTGAPQTWGFNVHRRRVTSKELSHFALQSRLRRGRGSRGFLSVSQFGALENISLPGNIRRIEARPYVLSSLHRGPSEPGDPFFDGSATRARAGADFRLGLGSSFTLDATVNPDFGQVEADPAVINLTAFESFFEERRPFFVEDAQVFDFRLSGFRNQLFYSRRIGRAPHHDAPDDADFAEIPDATTILGATKLTGRTEGGLSVGVLTALTQSETGRALLNEEGEATFPAEPRTEFAVATARQDFNEGRSQVSGIVTALHRGLPADDAFDDLVDQAYSAGVRFEHMSSDRIWRLHGVVAGSHIRGSPGALVGVQRASNHYFQRPDGTRARVDSSAISLSGLEWRLQFDRQQTNWTGSVWFGELTKGFEINDLGFSGSRERLDAGFRVGYLQILPGRIFRDYNLNFFTFNNFSHEALDDVGSWDSWRRAYADGWFNLDANFTLLSYHGGGLNLSWQPDRYDRTATRGGPVMLRPGRMGLGLRYNTDRRLNYVLNAGMRFSRGARDSGDELSINANLNLRPVPQLQLEVRPQFSIRSDAAQYVTSTSTLSYEPTHGRRYFFGELERKTVSVSARVSYALSPNLSLQIYTEPLLSSGDYVRYRQLAQTGTFDFLTFPEGDPVGVGGVTVCSGGAICRDAEGMQHVDLDGDATPDYTFRDRDFNVRSLIGNAVLRWEYRPGSTIFFVWQRQQEGDAKLGNFDFGRDLDALWGAPAHSRFIIKVNYWLGL